MSVHMHINELALCMMHGNQFMHVKGDQFMHVKGHQFMHVKAQFMHAGGYVGGDYSLSLHISEVTIV
jgi:hypothetical protein